MLWVYGVPIGERSGHDTVYTLLAYAYGQHVGGRLPELHRGTWGKPFFPNSEVEFSLTHTKTMAFCAISDAPVGVDAETIRPVRLRVAERTMNPVELNWMEACSNCDEAFFRLWTAKEAWAKLTGRGLGGRPKDIALSVGSDGPEGVAGDPAEFRWYCTNGVIATVCAERIAKLQWSILPALPAAETIEPKE